MQKHQAKAFSKALWCVHVLGFAGPLLGKHFIYIPKAHPQHLGRLAVMQTEALEAAKLRRKLYT